MPRKYLTLAEQYAIVMEVDKNPEVNKTHLANRYNISRPSINSMLKRKKSIVEKFQSGNFKSTAKRMKKYGFEDIDGDLLTWFRRVKADKLESITGSLLLKKARQLALEKGYIAERITIDWLNRWKRRHDISATKAVGEAYSVNPLKMTTWKTSTFSSLLNRYALKDVYNIDETALYWMALPDSIHKFRGDQCHGGKWRKERVTILVGSNADGSDKLPLLMVGRNQFPRCMKGKTAPLQYASNRTALMTSSIFEKWLRALDWKFATKNRQIALIMDNCPSHPLLQNLTNIELIFFPKNTTSHSQPMNAGVIRMLKGAYRKRLVMRLLSCYERNEAFKIDLFQSMLWLKASWNDILPENITACFQHLGFEPYDHHHAAVSTSRANVEEEPTERRQFLSLWSRLEEAGLLPPNLKMDEFLDLDSHIITGDNFIPPNVLESDDSEDDSEINNAEVKAVAPRECLRALETVRRFFHATTTEYESNAFLDRLEVQVLCERISHSSQKKITDFFARLRK